MAVNADDVIESNCLGAADSSLPAAISRAPLIQPARIISRMSCWVVGRGWSEGEVDAMIGFGWYELPGKSVWAVDEVMFGNSNLKFYMIVGIEKQSNSWIVMATHDVSCLKRKSAIEGNSYRQQGA